MSLKTNLKQTRYSTGRDALRRGRGTLGPFYAYMKEFRNIRYKIQAISNDAVEVCSVAVMRKENRPHCCLCCSFSHCADEELIRDTAMIPHWVTPRWSDWMERSSLFFPVSIITMCVTPIFHQPLSRSSLLSLACWGRRDGFGTVTACHGSDAVKGLAADQTCKNSSKESKHRH